MRATAGRRDGGERMEQARRRDAAAWRALALLTRVQDGHADAHAAIVGLRGDDGSPAATCAQALAEAVSLLVRGGPLDDAAALLERAEAAVHGTDLPPAGHAALVATRAIVLSGDDLGPAVAAHVRARALLPDDDGDDPLTRRLTHVALNALTMFCSRVGLVQDALDLAARSRALEVPHDDGEAVHDGGSATLNEALVQLEAALAHRTTDGAVDDDGLRQAHAQLERLHGDPRMVLSRGRTLRTALAAVRAWHGDPARAWDDLAAVGPDWDVTPFGPVPYGPAAELWVAGAAQALQRLVVAPGWDAGTGAAHVEVVRSAHRRLLRDGAPVRPLSVVATTAGLDLELALLARGLPDRVGELAAERERRLGALLAASRSALQAAVRSHARTEALAEQNAVLRRRVQVDALTGAGTRYHLERVLDGWDVSPPPRVGVVIADLDGFKQVNDEHGHLVGDEVLRAVGGLLTAAVREGDQLFRYGGDEFVVLLPGADTDAATECARRCQRVVAEHDWEQLHPGLVVTLTAGAHASDATARQLLGTADARLRRFKRSGPPATRPGPPATA